MSLLYKRTLKNKKMSESEFKEMLSRYNDGESSEAERRLIDEWLDSPNPKADIPFVNEAERIRIKNNLRESIYSKAGIRIKRRKYILSPALKIAASVILIAAIGFGGFKYYEYSEIKKYSVIETFSQDQIKKVMLSDGSIIWLKPGSRLKHPGRFKRSGERIVDLRGEALFEIEKDPARPFIVHSGELTATVLGTSFNIKTTEENIEVIVLTGKVSVTSASDKTGLVLLPEEKAVYIASSKELAREITPEIEPVQREITKGTEYDMKFSDTSMDEIIRRIEGKFDVDIRLDGQGLSGCMVTADFTGQSLVKTLDIISKVLSIDYKIDNKKITLKVRDNK